jgi:hypothetical protein
MHRACAVLAVSLLFASGHADAAPPAGSAARDAMPDVDPKQFDFEQLACSSKQAEPKACALARAFMKASAFSTWPKSRAVYVGHQYEATLDPVAHTMNPAKEYFFFFHLEPGQRGDDVPDAPLTTKAIMPYRGAWHHAETYDVGDQDRMYVGFGELWLMP